MYRARTRFGAELELDRSGAGSGCEWACCVLGWSGSALEGV